MARQLGIHIRTVIYQRDRRTILLIYSLSYSTMISSTVRVPLLFFHVVSTVSCCSLACENPSSLLSLTLEQVASGVVLVLAFYVVVALLALYVKDHIDGSMNLLPFLMTLKTTTITMMMMTWR